MRHKKRAWIRSVISLILCISMLMSTTFAWFTDNVSSGNNMIAAGNLDIEMEYRDASGNWKKVDESTEVLDKNALWEPGYTEVAYLKIINAGELALKYALGIHIIDETGSTNINGQTFKLSDHIKFGVIETDTPVTYANRADARNAVTASKTISQGFSSEYSLKENEDVRYATLVVYMPEDVDNTANYATGATPPEIKLGIELVATQAVYESDSFGTDYDTVAEMPAFSFPENTFGESTSQNVTTDGNNKVAEETTIQGTTANAVIPAGVQLEEGTSQVSLEVSSMNQSDANISLGENEEVRSLNVHIQGVASNNTQPMEITLKEAAAKGLNIGNIKLYHVENGTTVEMEAVDTFTAHNQFKYDPVTGDVTLYMATFSEVALVANTENAWNGEFDYSWYVGNGISTISEEENTSTVYTIANADQLAAFGAIVGGMAEGIEIDSFTGKTVKLICDINLGDAEIENNPDVIFYPIGYYNSKKSYEKISGESVTSSVSSFKGTFDGNGHTISNFYQNTWEMFGDYNDGYSGTPNYYKDAMGLFGYVNGGTVMNLTVENFSSDGEYTPTGVIAAYAAGKATFENIAITKCNPRVYNTGNGGIIGIAGNSNDKDTKIILKNITVDNSNKISALWGSWDVACGGLVGMFRGNADGGNGKIHFDNCHVAAQIDVYNDVCANYQYYAYRYAGMIIGSIRHNTKNKDGKTIPNMTGITATGCTVNYGDWNDYYYCEFEKNTMASYSEDYQFSRVDKSEIIFDENGKAIKCTHTHTDAEDKRAVYLPFHQLFTGYSWGVSSIGLKEYSGIVTDLGITEGEQEESVVKFDRADTETLVYTDKDTVYIGDLFKEATITDANLSIKSDTVQVTVSPVGEDSTVSGTYTANTNDWTQSTLTFSGTGDASVTITDYYFCIPTTIRVEIEDQKLAEKFEKKFTGNFLYRIGNQNTVALGSLFAVKNNLVINSSGVQVTVDNVAGNAYGTFTNNTSDWTKSTIKFNGTGVVKIAIQNLEDECCDSTLLELEVVDAVNVTSSTSATSNNIVLLNDCGFSSLEVSGGYTLYGNGFTMTCASDSPALDTGYAFVTLNNGILDNVQIVCPNFDYAVLYKSNMTEDGNRSESTDKTRYYNVKSGVMVSGNSQILNSRISGARAAVNVTGGNLVVDNSRIELGAVASLLVGSANSVTLRDVTLVQKPTASTYDSSKVLMGFSALFICDTNGDAAPVTLEGTLVQNAWINEDYKKYVPSDGQSIITTVLKKTDYLHDLNGDGTKESLNLGFAYMPESWTSKVNEPIISDKRTNMKTTPYSKEDVTIALAKAYVYSYKNTNGTNDSFKTESEYVPNKYGDIITVSYSDTADGLESGKSFGTDGWVYELNVDLDKASGYKLDFSKLSMSINGVVVTDFKVNGSTKPTSPVAVTSGGVTYTLTATVNGKECTATFKVTGTETSKESPSKISGPTKAGFGVAKSYGGDWSGAADVLTGVKVKYWSVAENKYVEFDFSNFTVPGNAGKLNGTNSYWEYTHTNNDFTLKVTNTVAIHSGKSVYGMPIRGTDGKLYFTISSTNGYVGSGTSSRAITMQYEFTDNNGGEKLTFTHTFNISYNKDDQYSYSDLSGSGKLTKLSSSSGGSDNCITPDTLITLADGSQVRVDSLTGTEELLVWNLETGKLDSAPIMFVDSDAEADYEVVHLYFSDGTDVKVIYEHGFWDYDLNKYVYLDRNADQYIGHYFAKQNGDKLEKVQLTDVVLETVTTTAWSPVTVDHLCYFVNGMLSMPGGVGGLFNIFDVDADTMTYDMEAMAKDIEKYGLFTYEELSSYVELSEDMFYAAGGPFLKISIAKGNMTMDELITMIKRYSKFI